MLNRLHISSWISQKRYWEKVLTITLPKVFFMLETFLSRRKRTKSLRRSYLKLRL